MAAAAGMSVAPLMMYTMGIFIQPLEQEFGWTRAAITSGLSVYAAISVLFSSIVGMVIDRIGPRRIAIVGVVGFVVAFGMLATINGSMWQWWTNWFAISLAAVLLKATVWVSAVTGHFDRARGMALALTLSGSSITAIAGPTFGGWLIEHYGWRVAYFGIAGTWAFVSLPLLIAYFHGVTETKSMSGIAVSSNTISSEVTQRGIRDSLLSSRFIKLAIACVMSYFVIIGSIVNMVPIISADGLAPSEAASVVGALGVASFGGRLLAGYWLDHYSATSFGTIVFALPAAACLILLYAEITWLNAVIIVVIFGVATGVEVEIASFITAKTFGTRNFGVLFGTIVGLLGISSGLAPITFGHIYDKFGSYDPAILMSLPLSVIAGMLIASLRNAPVICAH